MIITIITTFNFKTTIADLVQIAPQDFRKGSMVAIRDNLNVKYSNKIIQKIGLCICIYDVLWTSEGLIGHGDGLVNVNGASCAHESILFEMGAPIDIDAVVTVEFRIVVFRPFKNEIIFAKITESTPAGLHLRTDFFTDIFVPFEKLPDKCVYEPNEKLWVWQVPTSGDEEEAPEGLTGEKEPQYESMYFDNHEMVRVQVVDEEWHDLSPDGPVEAPNGPEEDAPVVKKTPPYRIIGSMQSEGLGVCLWWDQPDQDAEDDIDMG